MAERDPPPRGLCAVDSDVITALVDRYKERPFNGIYPYMSEEDRELLVNILRDETSCNFYLAECARVRGKEIVWANNGVPLPPPRDERLEP